MPTAYLYASLVALATVLGGLLPFTPVFKKVNNRYLIAFAAGAMLGIALFDLLPESAEQGGNLVWAGVGFVVVYVLERFFALHAHEGEHEHIGQKSTGLVSLVGIALESLIDGVAIGVGFAINPAVGVTIALAVLIHEIPRGFTTSVIMRSLGYGLGALSVALAIDAGFTIIGVSVTGLFSQDLFPNLIAFAAGIFLYVGGGDLLPPAHRKTPWGLIATTLVAIAIIYGVTVYVHGLLG